MKGKLIEDENCFIHYYDVYDFVKFSDTRLYPDFFALLLFLLTRFSGKCASSSSKNYFIADKQREFFPEFGSSL